MTIDAKSIAAKNKGQAITHSSPRDRENQVSPTTTTGDRGWKRTQERTGPHNKNLDSQGPEGPTETSQAGSTILTTTARNTSGKRRTPDTTPAKWEKEGPCQRMTGEKKRSEKSGDTTKQEGERKNRCGRGRNGTTDLGPPQPTGPGRPNYCGKRQRPRTTR